MQQHEFIWLAKQLKITNITQDDIGNTVVKLRDTISISHNYKKKNQIQIMFLEDHTKYIIPSKVELEEIYKMHLTNENLNHILRKYCEEKFK